MAKLRALEEMCDHSRATIAWRRSQGLSYIDPYTGELVKGDRVAEAPEPPAPTAPSSSGELHRPETERAGTSSTGLGP
jgi:hypothetical protein